MMDEATKALAHIAKRQLDDAQAEIARLTCERDQLATQYTIACRAIEKMAHPTAPMTVEAAAKVLLDFDGFHSSPAWANAIQAYTLRNGKVRPVALFEAWQAALRALSGEKS